MRLNLLSTNTKLQKNSKNYLILGLQLAPTTNSGYNVCSHASEGCKKACLFFAGMGKMPTVLLGRIRKTRLFFEDRKKFMSLLVTDIEKAIKICKNENKKLAIRLNTISDLPWEKIKVDGKTLMELFPNVKFYDYTKNINRVEKFARGEFPPNYFLLLSRSESNQKQVEKALELGANVAIVFSNEKFNNQKTKTWPLPKTFKGKKVVDGDKNDLRFLDPKRCIVGLRAKGDAVKDHTGFAVKVG